MRGRNSPLSYNMANIMTAYENCKEMVEGFEPFLISLLQSNKSEIVDYIQEQLYSGIDGNDEKLTPSYMNDTWFNSPEAGKWKNNAKGYMMWKSRITTPTPSYLGIPARGIQTPNLIITGEFYNSIRPVASEKGLRIETRGFTDGDQIESKYGSQIFGLSSYAKAYFIRYILLGEIDNYFKKYGQ